MRHGLWCLLVLGALALAQSTDAVLSGNVYDPSGAAVAAASLRARNTRTGVVFETKTNESGLYVFAAVPPGDYQVSCEHGGFRRHVIDEVVLDVGARQDLDFALELGSTADVIEVKAAAELQIGYLTSSVGSVIAGQKILDLPLTTRNAYDLLATQAGLVGDHFSGNRTGSLNFTLDGVNQQDNLLNGLGFAAIASTISVDRIEEFRVIVSPTDAELGRGSGQIQAITRGGTNQFHGSAFYQHRNTVLNANNWFNNQRGLDPQTRQPLAPRNFLLQNYFGGRVGGPLRKNRTFFHFNYERRFQRARNAVNSTVYTEPARRGLYRFFPGARNANALASIPTADLQGNPVRPPVAQGDLQTVNVFGRDASRPAPDPSGMIQKQLSLIPLPNNWLVGDGLNTAGYTWIRRVPVDFEEWDLRFDHNFNSKHRLTFVFGTQAYDSLNVTGPQALPDSPGGRGPNDTKTYSLTFTSVVRANLLNEARAGVFRPVQRLMAPWEVGGTDTQPKAGGYPYLISFNLVSSPLYPAITADPSNRITPVYQYSDTLSWVKGRHTFKGGGEVRFVSSAGYDANLVMPRATLGGGAAPTAVFQALPGIGQNLGGIQQLLYELAGSLNGAAQSFNSPGGGNPAFLAGENKQRNWRQPEASWFFKDDIRLRRDLTLNLGLRYEWYAVPFEAQGKGLALAGGGGAIFGISGTSFRDMFRPGSLNGGLTQLEPIGPNTPNAAKQLYEDDWNNFAPSAGLSWSLPWFGKNKTVLRAGYGIGYERSPTYLVHDVSGGQPGYLTTTTFLSASLISTANLRLPLAPQGKPLELAPLTDRTQNVNTYDDHLRTPYIQNFNVSLERAIGKSYVLDVRYVGSKGTRLVRQANINEANIFENGILEAYLITQAGGNAPLLDRIFRGLNIPGLGVVDGLRLTGSEVIRQNPSTLGALVNNNPGSLASYLSNTNQFTNENGGLLRRAGLAENFVFVNPQFSTATLTSNFASSTYHSLQVEMTKRFSSGWLFQGNYTWSKTLGEEEGEAIDLSGNFRTLRNRGLDKKLLSYHRTHVVRTNGIWELPFGPGKTLLRDSRGVLARLAGGWQAGWIFNVFSGTPIGLGAVGSFNNFGGNTPVAVTGIPKSLGQVEKIANGVVYFSGLRSVPDPYVDRITAAAGLRSRSTMLALTDASGRLLVRNPAPGELGNLAPRFLEGPGSFRLDVNLVKRIKVHERYELILRADAENLTNAPQFGNPNTDINSLNFGRITGASGNRIIVVSGRLSF
ncbi:MAG: carboxypeptidase regulatory-like domain-containing protein [Acidobacteria bacterium]|nr:carboxypeptidase regulatory-like domain-containing protein [Acidobacteriota bacterium]